MQLILDTYGMSVQKRSGCFYLVNAEKQLLVNPARVTSIAITTQCNLSTAAIRLAIQHGIPIYLLDAYGKVEGRLWSASFGHLSTIRRRQSIFDRHQEATNWVIRLIELKTQGQLSNLLYLKDRRKAQHLSLSSAEQTLQRGLHNLEDLKNTMLDNSRNLLMGYEGNMARYYWQAVSGCLPEPWTFDGRSRQPAQDPFNAALNYLYGMLYGSVETALFSAGLDPYLGLLHSDQYNRATLTYDIIEPFRPWIDRLLIEALLQQNVLPLFFSKTSTGVTLTKEGKGFFIPLLNRNLHELALFDGKRAQRRTHIYRLAGSLYDTLEHFDI